MQWWEEEPMQSDEAEFSALLLSEEATVKKLECGCEDDDAYQCYRKRYTCGYGAFGVSFGPDEPEKCWCPCHCEQEP